MTLAIIANLILAAIVFGVVIGRLVYAIATSRADGVIAPAQPSVRQARRLRPAWHSSFHRTWAGSLMREPIRGS
ncbi:MAG: hypothetical protein JO169_03030 [Solirubrobacterales bacterium]|nr:hypothetical protein [Solirubrobacterales bacterium]